MYKEPKTFTMTDVINFIDRAHGAERKDINTLKNEAIRINQMQKENLKGSVELLTISPLGGYEIEKLKNDTREFCIRFDCKAKFTHNSRCFVCDNKGNVAEV